MVFGGTGALSLFKRDVSKCDVGQGNAAMSGVAALRETRLKQRLREQPSFRAYGAFLMSASPAIAELMGRAGYDYLVVDLEHSPADMQIALQLLQACAAARCPTLIRVALNRPELIKKALDLGPDGLVVPLVDNVEEAKAAVAACRYPPRGIRGVAVPLVRASGWGLDKDYVQRCEDDMLLLCQVETPAAIDSISQILDVDGVDGVFVGPLDLSASLGHLGNAGHSEVRAAIEKVETAAAQRPEKILAGFSGGRATADMYSAGYRMVASTADVALIRQGAMDDVKGAAAAAKEAPGKNLKTT